MRREKRSSAAGTASVTKAGTPALAEHQEAAKPEAPGVRAGVDLESELPQKAERAVLDILRQAGAIRFWMDSISRQFGPGEVSRWLKVGSEVAITEAKLRRVVSNVRREYEHFTVGVENTQDERGRPQLIVEITLREGVEWREAWEEAWSFAEKPHLERLSANALRLYQWAKGPKNTGDLTDRKRIGRQAQLRGSYGDMENHFEETRFHFNRLAAHS